MKDKIKVRFKKIKSKGNRLLKQYKTSLNIFVFVIFTLIPTYFWYQEKLQADAFEAYITAKNYFTSKQYKQALPHYEKAFKLNSNVPNVSYEYGRTLYKLEDYSQALAIWENVPQGEKHEYYEYYKARSYQNLIKSIASNERKNLYMRLAKENYKRAMKVFKGKEDPAYWYSRYGYIVLGSQGKNSDLFKKEVNQFALDTRSFLSNLTSFKLELGTDYTILDDKLQKSFMLNWVNKGIMFKLYIMLAQKYLDESKKYLDENKNLMSIESILTAFEYQSHPFDIVKNLDIECALKAFSKTISFQDMNYVDKLANDSRFEKVITNIYNSNLENGNMEISNIAAVLLNLYCKKDYDLVMLEYQKDLNMILKFSISDKEGLNSLILNSSSFNYINKEFEIKNKTNFDLDLKESIFEIKKFDFVNIYVKDTDGNVVVQTISPYLSPCEDDEN